MTPAAGVPFPAAGRDGPVPPATAPSTDRVDGAYWLGRERAARALASRATEQHIAWLHLEMAERYAAIVNAAAPPTR